MDSNTDQAQAKPTVEAETSDTNRAEMPETLTVN